MPRKKKVNYEEPIPERPHRNMKVRVVYDPSDTDIPKKRRKYSCNNENPIKATTVKKTTNYRKTQQDTTKLKNPPVNIVSKVTKLMDGSSTEINSTSQIHSPINGQVISVPPEITLDTCFICSKTVRQIELIDCPICLIKVHKHCLIVNEPMWKFKLDFDPWFCKQCRIQNCIKCLKDDSQSKILRRCITCEVGLHIICYESYEIKPLQKLKTDMYVCIPCMTLATQINPEEEEEEEEEDAVATVKVDIYDDVNKSHTSSSIYISSEEDSTDLESNGSNSSSECENRDEIQNDIPNISKWTKQQVFEYLAEKLPTEIIDQIVKNDFDGDTLLLLQRSDILSLGLKLGHALTFYKEVRILQSQTPISQVSWY